MPKNVVLGLGSIRLTNSDLTSFNPLTSPMVSNSNWAPVYSRSPSGMNFSILHECIRKIPSPNKKRYFLMDFFKELVSGSWFVFFFFRAFLFFGRILYRIEQLTEFVKLPIKNKGKSRNNKLPINDILIFLSSKPF